MTGDIQIRYYGTKDSKERNYVIPFKSVWQLLWKIYDVVSNKPDVIFIHFKTKT